MLDKTTTLFSHIKPGNTPWRSEGLRGGPAEVMARLARGEAVGRDEYYFRTVVRFTTGAPQWLHLNKVLALAVGQREAGVVKLDCYRLT